MSTIRRYQFHAAVSLPVLVLVTMACSLVALAEDGAGGAASEPSSVAVALTSEAGRGAVAAGIWFLVALLKLVPLRAASGGAKLAAVVALALTAGATALGTGADLASALGTALAAASSAVLLHETLGKILRPLAPLVARAPRVGAFLERVILGFLAPAPRVAP